VSEQRARLIDLLRERSFERRRVVLASGRESDFFIDCKQTALTAEGHALIGELMLDALGDLPDCQAVGGVATCLPSTSAKPAKITARPSWSKATRR
jgi:orotate phosphoribosyltransferase